MIQSPPGQGFDRIARAYRWLEYLTFGRALERCRLRRLSELAGTRRCLILGDGDGRFTAALLAAYPLIEVVAVDASGAMLALLQARVQRTGAAARLTPRLTLLQGDVRQLLATHESHPALSPANGFDCICTHFFLDCLSTAEVEALTASVCLRLTPGASWIVSEFATPTWWAALIVWLLYRGFAVLTGLQLRQLPLWRQSLAAHGFTCVGEDRQLRGLLTSSAWQRHTIAVSEESGPQGNRA